MNVSLDRGTTIGRLRLRAAAADPDRLAMRGRAAVGALDLQPSAMPEQAILCIRTLHDPRPGGLDLRSRAASRPIAWEAAMRGVVAEALRRAARPAFGAVPASADSVLFSDRAELLACAARDARGGGLAGGWWWHHLLGGERSLAAVVGEWARAPAYIPAAVELLAARREIVPFACALAPAEALRLVEAVLGAHALPALAREVVAALSLHSPPASPAPAPPATSETARQPAPPAGGGPRAGPSLDRPPWQGVVPDLAPAALAIEQQCLVALALVLRRAPVLARSEGFARELVAWIGGVRRTAPREVAGAGAPGAGEPDGPGESGPPGFASHRAPAEPQAAPAAEPEGRAGEHRQRAPLHPDRHLAERIVVAAAPPGREMPVPAEICRGAGPQAASARPRPPLSLLA